MIACNNHYLNSRSAGTSTSRNFSLLSENHYVDLCKFSFFFVKLLAALFRDTNCNLGKKIKLQLHFFRKITFKVLEKEFAAHIESTFFPLNQHFYINDFFESDRVLKQFSITVQQ